MAEEQLGQERSEEPTSKRLDEARKKGQVARSRELNTFLVVVGGLTFLWMTSNQLSSATGSLMSEFLSPTDELMTNPDLLLPYLGSGLQLGILVVSPLLLVTVFLALVGPGIMGGVTFSVDALAFKPEKLDPIKGLTRIFSTKGLVELLKALLKFFLLFESPVFALL